MIFFTFVNAFDKFCKKLTVAGSYKGIYLKYLIEQRWLGHLATVAVILKYFNNRTSLTNETDSVPAFGTKFQMETVGLLHDVISQVFHSPTKLVHRVWPTGTTKEACSEVDHQLNERFKHPG